MKIAILKLLIFSIIVMLFSCVNDSETQGLQKVQKNFSRKIINYDALLANKKLISRLDNVNLEKNLITNTESKIIHSEDNKFDIDTNEVLFIQENNYKHSYTFKIVSDNSKYNLENLVLALNDSLKYDIYRVSYDLTENELSQLQDGVFLNIVNKIKILKINDNDLSIPVVNISSKYEGDRPCLISVDYVFPTNCPCENHSFGQTCTCPQGTPTEGGFVFNYGDCGISGGGSNGSNSGGFSTGPHGGGGGDALTLSNPCVKLKDLFNMSKANIKPSIINDLRPNIAVNTSGEKGHALTKNNTGAILGVPILPTSINVTPVPSGGYYYSALHTNPFDTAPMFSFSDVMTLNSLNNNSASFNEGLASFLLICKDDNNVFQTYAIVFDPESLNETIDQFMTNPENIGCSEKEITEKKNEELRLEYNVEYNSANPNYEKVFLKKMFYSNVSLYQANSTLTNWSKLSISSNISNPTVNSTNCN